MRRPTSSEIPVYNNGPKVVRLSWTDMAPLITIGPLIVIAIYGVIIIGIVLLVRAVVRIGYALVQISSSLEDIAASLRNGSRMPD